MDMFGPIDVRGHISVVYMLYFLLWDFILTLQNNTFCFTIIYSINSNFKFFI